MTEPAGSHDSSVLSSADIYDAFAPQYRDYSAQKRAYIQAVDGLIAQRFKGRVRDCLDYGAGDGVRGATLARQLKVPNLVQGDISRAMLDRCQQLGVAAEVWDLTAEQQAGQRFDLIVCLWNVLGHVPDNQQRIEVLTRLREWLQPGGHVCFDVNNRHNRGYGRLKVLYRRILDRLMPNVKRGDASFDWNIGGKSYPAFGHLFTRAEVDKLLQAAGLSVVAWCTVDYVTGEVSDKVDGGHLFYVVQRTADA